MTKKPVVDHIKKLLKKIDNKNIAGYMKAKFDFNDRKWRSD